MTVVLDHFAGTGWGVACQRLGITEHGVELMPEAVASRDAAGMSTVYRDVWDGLIDPMAVPDHDVYIASPPCQTFSVAGKGAGRRSLDDVLEAITTEAWRYPPTLRLLGEDFEDERTALVLTPLAHIWQHRPRAVALEQVPTVLPVWEAFAKVMCSLMGYSVVTGVLNAEQYGVPQTRKRAILIARLDGEARLPQPTHSRYYSREPERLDGGVLPWVSMAEALGWGLSGRPSPTITGGGTETGGAEPIAKLARYTTRPDWVHRRPAPTIVGTRRSSEGIIVGRQLDDGSRQDVGGHQTNVGLREGMLPGVRVTAPEAAVLQSYPSDFPFQGGKGKRFLQIGNAVPPLLAEHIIRAATSGQERTA